MKAAEGAAVANNINVAKNIDTISFLSCILVFSFLVDKRMIPSKLQ
jgi:hypothetical protein